MLSDCEAVVPPDDARLVNCGAAGFSAEFIIFGPSVRIRTTFRLIIARLVRFMVRSSA